MAVSVNRAALRTPRALKLLYAGTSLLIAGLAVLACGLAMLRVQRQVWPFDCAALILIALLAQFIFVFIPMFRRIGTYSGEIIRLATTDPLTALANRRGFLERSEIEHMRARRFHRPLCLLMIDADHFKRVNDTHGHEAGDLVLKSLAKSFLATLRETDMVARLGGEEFAVLLPETDLQGAAYAAERLRLRVAQGSVKFRGKAIKVTVSIGVTLVKNEPGGIEEALHAADELMYRAKSIGRNCIIAAEEDARGSGGALN